MPAKPSERQYRSLAVPLNVRAADGATKKRFDTEYYVEGYASTFNDPYVLFEDFDGTKYIEVISPDAFREADMSDVILQFDHAGRVYARMSNGTLIVEPDEHGLFIAADLSRSQGARDLFEEIKAGLITRMSWAFTVAADEYDRETHTTTITRVKKVFDVSAVSLPADPNTEISARNLLNGAIEQSRKELARRKSALAVARATLAIAKSERFRTMDEMTMDDLLNELQGLVDKYKADDGTDTEPTEQDAERMSALTAEIEKRNAAAAQRRDSHTANVAAARAAIENGTARHVDSVPMGTSASARGALPQVRDTTDYNAAARRAWVKDIASRSGVQLIGGTELTQVERDAYNHLIEQRTAFTHLTSNTDTVIPVELQTQIFTLIDNTAVLYGDIHKDNFPHQFELIRHKSIKAGDAAKTDEGAAPTDEEQNEFDTITLTGEEIKKTVKMSRKMAVQSISGFEQYIVNETGARLAVAANARTHAKTVDTTLGMGSGNKIKCATAGTLKKADITKLLGMLYTYGNPAPKGCIIYANGNTIWNHIAMVEDANGRSYFVDEKTEDPAVEGHIFGKLVKRDDSMADGIIKAGYPDLFRGNIFNGVDVTPYVEPGTQKRCFDGYLLFDGGLVVPKAFGQLTIGTAAK